jgi:hypothetical protein
MYTRTFTEKDASAFVKILATHWVTAARISIARTRVNAGLGYGAPEKYLRERRATADANRAEAARIWWAFTGLQVPELTAQEKELFFHRTFGDARAVALANDLVRRMHDAWKTDRLGRTTEKLVEEAAL